MSQNNKMIIAEIEMRGFLVSDISIDDCTICDECSAVLLPDDECYYEFDTDKELCTECCFYDEYLDCYIRGTIEASHTRLRVQLDVT